MKIRDRVDIIPQPTVVRLEHLQSPDAGWISDSYYITEETGRHFKALKSLFAKEKGCGAFLIGHYGSGKSHFLAYLTQQLRAGTFETRALSVLPLSLLNYKASQSLEDILGGLLSVTPGEHDRRKTWRRVSEQYPNGLVLLIDELSEFLRSKPTPQSFNEDLRFLQFLGEWAQDHPLWILAAMQEQIEHTGEIEYDLFRKIKDRFPIRFLLTPAHVKDLIAERILRKKPSYLPAVEKLAAELSEIYPKKSVDYGVLRDIYPIHPITLELLEEVRDRFSQARGIVDFTLTQLLGDEARGIPPFLDRPWGHLLTPDAIVDHFADLFEVQPEFLAIAQKVLPHCRKQIPILFPNKSQGELAWRLVKLLVLVHLSPRRTSLSAEDAAQWLFLKVSYIDPAKNREVVGKILDTLCRQGSFVKRLDSRYCLDLEDDSREQLEQWLCRAMEELKGRGDFIFESLVPLLEQAEFNPFTIPRDRWFVRKVRWHFHEWDLNVYMGSGIPKETPREPALQIGLPWGPPAAAARSYKIVPKPIESDPEIIELCALLQLKERPLPARVLDRIQERIAARSSWFRTLIRSAYANADFIDPGETRVIPPLNPMQGGQTGWLNAYGESILRHTYPLFEQFAPGHGPLPKEAYRQFMQFASENDLGDEAAPEHVRLIREAYLVPMGLMQRRGPDYTVNQKLDNHELVRLIAPLFDHHPAPDRIYRHLSAPVYGLVPDQIHLLLIMLLIQGEIDIVKGNRSYREIYETLIYPQQYDTIIPGHALSSNQLHYLQEICEGFRIPIPRQWSVLAQKRAIEQLRRFGSKNRGQLSDFAAGLKAQWEAGDLVEQIESHISRWLALEKGEHELQGFQHFLHAIGSTQRFIAEANELASMPSRFERLLRETRRYRHLFSYPAVSQCANPHISARVEALGAPPPLAQSEALEAWLRDAQTVYEAYRKWYQEEHERSWKTVSEHPIWTYKVPALAYSRHCAVSDTARTLETVISGAKTGRCAGLGPLDFQPVCRCGFDGAKNPLLGALRHFDEASGRLERDLTLFFQQDAVKAKVREWVDQGLEINTTTLSYLEGKTPYPEIENVALFDQHLSGLELVHAVEAKSLVDFLGQRTWEKPGLMKALDRFFERFGPRITFRHEEPPARADLVAWCCEQALRQGCALPKGLSSSERALIPDLIQPQWIHERSLKNLDQMNLDESAVVRILDMLLSGLIPLPRERPSSGAVAAALELLDPCLPADAAGFAELLTNLYEQSDRFLKLRPQLWLSHLEKLASIKLAKPPPPLNVLLKSHMDAQWMIIDCLGLPLLKTFESILPQSFPHWKLQSVEFAMVSEQTSTEAFYMGLIGGDLRKAFEKVDSVDALIHGRKINLKDLARLVRAELDVAFRKVAARFDSGRPILIYGDHGFRMAPDGVGFSHGGASTAERITAVFKLAPV